jgi:hypothetical protein
VKGTGDGSKRDSILENVQELGVKGTECGDRRERR